MVIDINLHPDADASMEHCHQHISSKILACKFMQTKINLTNHQERHHKLMIPDMKHTIVQTNVGPRADSSVFLPMEPFSVLAVGDPAPRVHAALCELHGEASKHQAVN